MYKYPNLSKFKTNFILYWAQIKFFYQEEGRKAENEDPDY